MARASFQPCERFETLSASIPAILCLYERGGHETDVKGWKISAGPPRDAAANHPSVLPSQVDAPRIRVLPPQPTGHVLIQGQRHSHVTDLDGFKIPFNDDVGRFDVSVEQLLVVVKVLRAERGR